MPESDVKSLELLLDFRVCYAGTVRAVVSLAWDESRGRPVPAINVEFA